MKKRMLIMFLFALTMSGCSNSGTAEDLNLFGGRFATISFEANGIVVYDTKTGVEYWKSSYGITPLVDKDGNPLIYAGE